MAYNPALPTYADIAGTPRKDERPGLWDIASSAAQGAWGSLRYGLPAAVESVAGTLTPQDQKYYGAWNQYYQDKANNGAQAASLDDITSGRVGVGRAFLENVAASLPYMATSAAGAIAGTAVAPGPGTIAGALGGGLGSAVQFVGTNASRAMQENGGVLTPDAAERSIIAAPFQAATEVAGEAFVPGLGRFLGPVAAKFEGNVLSRAAKGIAAGFATEALGETAQQVAERWSAGLPMTGKEATQEFVQSFAIGGLVGAGFGALHGPLHKKIQAQDAAQTSTEELSGSVDEALQPQIAGYLPAPSVHVDAAGRAGYGTQGLNDVLAAPRTSDVLDLGATPGVTQFDQTLLLPRPGMFTDSAGRSAEGAQGLTDILAQPRAPGLNPGETHVLQLPAPDPARDTLFGTPERAASPSSAEALLAQQLAQQPSGDLKALLERAADPKRANVPTMVVEAVERELAGREAASRGGDQSTAGELQGAAPASASEDIWKGVRLNQDLKKLQNATPEELHAGVRALLEKGDARKGTFDLAQKLGIDVNEKGSSLAAPAGEDTQVEATPKNAEFFDYAKRTDDERAALSQLMTPEALDTIRAQAVEAMGRPLPEGISESAAERLNTRIQKVAEELGLLDQNGLTDVGKQHALRLPVDEKELADAVSAHGLDDTQAEMFKAGAKGTPLDKFTSLSDVSAYLAGQQWKVPQTLTATETGAALYGSGEKTGSLTDGGRTKPRSQTGEVKLDAEQQRRQWLNRAIDEGNYSEPAQLKRMVEEGASDAEVNAAAELLRQGDTLFPDGERQQVDMGPVLDTSVQRTPEGEQVVGEVKYPYGVKYSQLERDQIRQRAGERTTAAQQATEAQLTAKQATKAEQRAQTQAAVAAKEAHQARKAELHTQIEDAAAAGDLTPKQASKLHIMTVAGAHDRVASALDAAATQGPVGVFRDQMNTTRRGFLAGAAATLATTAIDQAQAKVAPLTHTAASSTLQTHLANGNITGALRSIKESSTNPIYRLIAGKLLNAGGWDNVTLALGEDRGLLYGSTQLNEDGSSSVELYGEHGKDEETVLHELIHAFVQQRWAGIRFYTPGNEKQLHMDADRHDSVIRGFQDIWREIGRLVQQTNPELLDSENPNDAWSWNASDNPDEALSWLMTNKQAQAYLKSFDAEGNKLSSPKGSVWNRFVKWIADLLGLPYNDKVSTMLDKVLDAGYSVLDAGKDVRVGEFNKAFAADFYADKMSVKPPRSAKEVSATIKDVAGKLGEAADKLTITSALKKSLLGLQTIHHMAEVWGDKVAGLKDYERIDAERHATQAKFSQLFVGWHQTVDKADTNSRGRLNSMMRLTEFNADPRKRWADQPWLHDHPNAAELKTLVEAANNDYNTLKNRGLASLYDDAVALNDMQLYADLTADIHGMISYDQEYSQGVKGVGSDPTQAFRESPQASGNPKAARDYWKAQLDARVKAATDYVEESRGKIALLSRKDQNVLDRKLTAMESQLAQTSAALSNMKQGPYFHMGRHGDQFIAFTAKNTQGKIDKGSLAKIQQAFSEAGLDNVFFSNESTQASMYARFENATQRKLAEDVLAKLQAVGAIDPETEVLAGPRENSGVYQARAAKGDWVNTILADIKTDLTAEKEGATAEEKKELNARYAAIEAQLRSAWLDTVSDNSLVKVMTARKGRPGYDADMIRSFATRAQMSSLALANKTATPQITSSFAKMRDSVNQARRLGDPNHGDVQSMFNVMNEVMLRQVQRGEIEKTVVGDKFRAATNAFFLGASPGYVLTQITQIPVMLLPELGKKHGFGKSFSAIARATPAAMRVMKAVAAEATQHDWKRAGDMAITPDILKKAGLAPGQLQFLVKMMASGAIDIGSAARELGWISSGATDSKLDTTLRLATATGLYSETATRLVAVLAAHDLNGAEGAEAYAHRVLDEAMFNYASSNTARLLGKKGVAGQWTPIMTQFMQYSAQLMEKLYRETHAAMGGDREAAKFLAGHATAMAVLAGTLGLPFATMAARGVELLHDLFDDDDDPYDATAAYRNWLAGIFGKDMGEVLARGAPRALGFDLSARIGEQDLIPFSGFLTDRRSIKDAAADQALRSFGAPVSMGVSIVSGLSRMADGDLSGAQEAMPVALRNVAKALSTSATGKFTDTKGNTLPIDPKASDSLYMLLGLTPADRAEYTEAQGDKVQRETAINRRASVLRSQIVDAALSKDTNALREGLAAAAAFDNDNPAFAILPDISGAVQRKVQQTQVAKQLGTPLGVKVNDFRGQQLAQYANF